ncbi:nitroreductase family protein [Metabacillus sp. JX24]|uniref:nitroreductase family protein n=1 Tax=Metabacillus sp. JX24 TaxID=3240759 RepID=UPI00351035B8
MIKSRSSVSSIIRERTSIKTNYLPKEVEEETVVSLLNDAVWAPTHGLREPWRFIFVSGERKTFFIEAVLSCLDAKNQEKMRGNLMDVPAFLIAVMPEDPRQKIWEEDFAAVCTLIQNLQLLGWENELGMVWKTPNHMYDPRFRRAIGVQNGEKVVGILQLGYFDPVQHVKERKRTCVSEKWTSF